MPDKFKTYLQKDGKKVLARISFQSDWSLFIVCATIVVVLLITKMFS